MSCTGRFVPLDGAILEIWQNPGAGTLLFYPGTMLEPGHYFTLLRAFAAAGFAIAALHLPGHGAAVHLPLRSVRFADFLNAGLRAETWLNQNGFGPIAVAGHSQGGMLAIAHASRSRLAKAAFAIGAVLPQMAEAINVTRFAPLTAHRNVLLAIITAWARIMPWLPLPLPFYLQIGRILAGRRKPVLIGAGKGPLFYPLGYLASLFGAHLDPHLHCPFWLFSAHNDALFDAALTRAVFAAISAPQKELVWLTDGGHMAVFNPFFASFVARASACACAGLGFPLNIQKMEE